MRRRWSDDDIAEYELLITESLAERSVPSRRDIFLAGLDDGVQSHRAWALDILCEIRLAGADRILKREHETRIPKVPVTRDGQVLGDVPRIMGVRRRNGDGQIAHERTLFDYMTFTELREKLPWFAQQIEAYERDAHAVIRLLALESRVPGATTPQEACERLGITVEQWLASEDAA